MQTYARNRNKTVLMGRTIAEEVYHTGHSNNQDNKIISNSPCATDLRLREVDMTPQLGLRCHNLDERKSISGMGPSLLALVRVMNKITF